MYAVSSATARTMSGMPRPRPSLVAREDVEVREVSDVAPSGNIGVTVGTVGVILAKDEEEERVRDDAMIDMVVVLGTSVDGIFELVMVPD